MSVAKASKMDNKKVNSGHNTSISPGRWLFDFVGDVKAELRKVTWTSQEELISYTKIVVAATFSCGIAVFGVDVVIRGVLSGLGAILGLITG